MTSKWRLIDGKELYDIKADPGQESDVATAYPAEVRRLREFYEGWWEELKPSFERSTAIYLGHPEENPTTLTCHDWITTSLTPWNQSHVRQGDDAPENTGFWNVKVVKSGKYEIRLRRWPDESNGKINAGMEPGEAVTGQTAFRETPGRKFDLNSASIKIGDKDLKQDFETDALEVVFTTELAEGRSEFTATFHAADGSSVGAYYAYVKLIE